jgi:hypothetical protein
VLYTKGAKHGRRKMKINWSEQRVFIPKQIYFSANDDMLLHGKHLHTNWCSAAVLADEQLPDDGLVRPKHIAIICDFNDILK